MPFDPADPDGDLDLKASNPILRGDKTFLKNGLEREHHFDGNEAAGASGRHLMHKMGSARVFVYDNATALNPGTLASTYSKAIDRNTGIVVVDQQAGRVYFCTDGATDEWWELSQIGGDLEIGGNLVVPGDASIDGDVTLLTGTTVTTPAGEEWLADDTAPTPIRMNPFEHGARHRPGGTDGAWTADQDFVPYSLQRILSSATLLNGSAVGNAGASVDGQSFGAAGDAKCSINFSTLGRPTTSRGKLYAEITVEKNAGNGIDNDRVEIGLYRDAIGNRLGARAFVTWQDDVPDGGGQHTVSIMRLVTGLTAGAHELALHAWSTESSLRVLSVQLIYEDLGTE